MRHAYVFMVEACENLDFAQRALTVSALEAGKEKKRDGTVSQRWWKRAAGRQFSNDSQTEDSGEYCRPVHQAEIKPDGITDNHRKVEQIQHKRTPRWVFVE